MERFPVLLVLCALHGIAGIDAECRPCTGCPGQDSEILSQRRELNSPTCPEGSVATLESLRSSASQGGFKVWIKNAGGSYNYPGGTKENVTCFEAVTTIRVEPRKR